MCRRVWCVKYILLYTRLFPFVCVGGEGGWVGGGQPMVVDYLYFSKRGKRINVFFTSILSYYPIPPPPSLSKLLICVRHFIDIHIEVNDSPVIGKIKYFFIEVVMEK